MSEYNKATARFARYRAGQDPDWSDPVEVIEVGEYDSRPLAREAIRAHVATKGLPRRRSGSIVPEVWGGEENLDDGF